MTSIQLAQRALRILTARDLASLGMDDAMHVVDAMNEALGAYAALLPAERRISADSRPVRAPLSLAVTMTAGAKAIAYAGGPGTFPTGGYATEKDAIGCSCLLSGDSSVNRLNRPAELLRPYLGSAASGTLTLYNDAHGFDSESLAIHGPVRWLTGAQARELRPVAAHTSLPATLQTGEPELYTVENHLNLERDALPMFILRLWPIPAIAGAVDFQSEVRFPSLKFVDLQTSKPLAVPEQDIPQVTALLHDALLLSPLLKPEPGLKSTIATKAAAARETLSGNASPRHAAAPHFVLTPPGF